MSTRTHRLTTLTAIGTGLAGGVFFAFSTFVMPAVDSLPTSQSIEAMQAINRDAPNPLFMALLFAPALSAAYLVFKDKTPLVRTGALTYLIGVIGVTALGNVPLNDTLATVHAHGPHAADHWHTFMRAWMPLNHVRTLSGLVSCATLTAAAAGLKLPATTTRTAAVTA